MAAEPTITFQIWALFFVLNCWVDCLNIITGLTDCWPHAAWLGLTWPYPLKHGSSLLCLVQLWSLQVCLASFGLALLCHLKICWTWLCLAMIYLLGLSCPTMDLISSSPLGSLNWCGLAWLDGSSNCSAWLWGLSCFGNLSWCCFSAQSVGLMCLIN